MAYLIHEKHFDSFSVTIYSVLKSARIGDLHVTYQYMEGNSLNVYCSVKEEVISRYATK